MKHKIVAGQRTHCCQSEHLAMNFLIHFLHSMKDKERQNLHFLLLLMQHVHVQVNI